MSEDKSLTSIGSIQMLRAQSILRDILPTDVIIELNALTRSLTLLNAHPPHIVAQQQFTKNEWSIFIILLTFYPHYAPYEILLSSITSLSPADCRERLEKDRQLGQLFLKRELKPVYRALSGARAKLNKIYPLLKISLIRDAGYVLVTPHSEKY